MPGKLKTYTTSIGFYDLAIAAPSMKAALEAWGMKQNLFHEGLAQQTDEAAVVAATMDNPGVVLRRAVGTNAPYKERPDPPKALPADAKRQSPKPKAKPTRKAKEDKQPKATVIEFEAARKRREANRKAEEAQQKADNAAAAKDDERRRKVLKKAEAKRARSFELHKSRMQKLESQRKALDHRIDAERLRWNRERKTD